MTISFCDKCNAIFDRVIEDYHKTDSVTAICENPYSAGSMDALLYEKTWIDTVQWHLEDIIRDPGIDPSEALQIKRRIDLSNQKRTDLVERIDSFLYERFSGVSLQKEAGLNTETPAWAIDRLSILALKIYHMRLEAERKDSPKAAECAMKRDVLLTQRHDLSTALNQLLDDLEKGRKYMKLYKQMKMYNDPLLNPVLYGKK